MKDETKPEPFADEWHAFVTWRKARTVEVTEVNLEGWGRVWPCATLTRPFFAQFDHKGGLVDTDAPEDCDGQEFDALVFDVAIGRR